MSLDQLYKKKWLHSVEMSDNNFGPAAFDGEDFAGRGFMPYMTNEKLSERQVGYTLISDKFNHQKPCRNALGLVGGNEVSATSGNLVDLESDLRGITRALTSCPAKQFIPECAPGSATACPDWPSRIQYKTKDTNETRIIGTAPRHLPTCQMNSYQAVPHPKPFSIGTCEPNRF